MDDKDRITDLEVLDYRIERFPGKADSSPRDTQRSVPPELPKDALILLAVRGMVLFPGSIVPISVGREISIAGAEEASRSGKQIGVILQRDAEVTNPKINDLYQVGTIASVMRYITAQDGTRYLISQGKQRFRIIELLEGYPFLAARVEYLSESETIDDAVEARSLQLKERVAQAIQLLPQAPEELINAAKNVNSPSALADLVASVMDIDLEQKQDILETLDISKRVDKVLEFLIHRIHVLQLSKEIGQRAKESMNDQQREYLLREQMKAIRQELGENDSNANDIADLAQAIDAAKMPEEVEKHAKKELKRLERMAESAAEHSMLRTYLEWLTELPWSVTSEGVIDIHESRKILDEDHYGLEKIKKRILEFLAVRKLKPEGKSPILCFVGPPGVGKTSLGQSIARATGRKFVRVSLGGVHDEAEIRGHRRTYIGALPGNIIQAIRKAGTHDCVMMLDEMDKLGAGFHGDPSAALLEVLDPEQNFSFRDNYLGVPFDLSKVIFLGTANMLDTIPGPLRDRMEIIQLPGYTEMEKVQVARRYLVKRQLEANGLSAEQGAITDDAIHAIIGEYTREAGVRNLEREIGSAFRHVAMRIAEGSAEKILIDRETLHTILGPRKFENEIAMRTSVPGVATGLAWTPVGGDILFIEANRVSGKGKLILTGQLGDVMKESVQAALTLVKSRAEQLGINTELIDKSDIHVHVPAGAIPKDGPSAGVAMFIALASLMTNRPVDNEIAMTGEISLRGLVLPVGGIKEKVVAAMRAGIKTVMLPARNKREYDEIPEEARNKLRFVWLETVDDALQTAVGTLENLEVIGQ
jgi:ATP-dependent Lon protease